MNGAIWHQDPRESEGISGLVLIRELKCVFLAGRWGRQVQIHLVFCTDKPQSQEGASLYNQHITHGNILERFYGGILENMFGGPPWRPTG